MKTFTIDTENNIAIHASAKQAKEVENADRFQHEEQMTALAAFWPAARLVEIWNSIPGVTPVKKFTNRKAAVSRIWKAIQNLGGDVAQPVRDLATDEGNPSPNATPTKPARSGAEKAKASNGKAPREGSKTEIVLGLLKRKGGVRAQELMEATGWQAHSVRGFLSGTVGKKMGLTVISAKEGDVRTYSLEA